MLVLKKTPSHSWWFDSHNSPRRSPWLQSTLSELDEKTKSMLKLIEEDADSFAQRAEMYYKKRPELINMVEDFYRAHRSLAERYDQLKLEAGTRLMTSPTTSSFSSKSPSTQLTLSPFWTLSQKLTASPFSTKSPSQKPTVQANKFSETSSDCFDSEESEVDDPEHEGSHDDPEHEGSQADREMGEDEEISSKDDRDCEVMKLREEIERLKEQNNIYKAELMERNDEKREAIRQLCVAMDMVKDENISLKKRLKGSKKSSLFEFSKWKGLFPGQFFSGHPKSETNIIAL